MGQISAKAPGVVKIPRAGFIRSLVYLFIHSCNKYLPNSYSVAGILLILELGIQW